MPALVKGDDARSGTKANARHGSLGMGGMGVNGLIDDFVYLNTLRISKSPALSPRSVPLIQCKYNVIGIRSHKLLCIVIWLVFAANIKHAVI